MHYNNQELRRLSRQSLRILKFRNAIYLNNPKAACSTVKLRLINIENQLGNTNIHNIENGETLHDRKLPIYSYSIEDFIRAKNFVFTFVRNPFARVLSTYLDKMHKNVRERHNFCRLSGINKDKKISFLFFLRNICKFSEIQDDPHWRCQSTNILYNIMPIKFIGTVETLEEDFKYLSKKFDTKLPQLSHKRHSTNAKDMLANYINEEAKDLIIKKYYHDFYNFNYSYNFYQQSPLKRPNGCEERKSSVLKIKRTFFI